MLISKKGCNFEAVNQQDYMLRRVITPQEVAIAKKDLGECRNVVIVCHTSPDGDAIGSSLAQYEYLKRKG